MHQKKSVWMPLSLLLSRKDAFSPFMFFASLGSLVGYRDCQFRALVMPKYFILHVGTVISAGSAGSFSYLLVHPGNPLSRCCRDEQSVRQSSFTDCSCFSV